MPFSCRPFRFKMTVEKLHFHVFHHNGTGQTLKEEPASSLQFPSCMFNFIEHGLGAQLYDGTLCTTHYTGRVGGTDSNSTGSGPGSGPGPGPQGARYSKIRAHDSTTSLADPACCLSHTCDLVTRRCGHGSVAAGPVVLPPAISTSISSTWLRNERWPTAALYLCRRTRALAADVAGRWWCRRHHRQVLIAPDGF